jgi:ATP-dependent Zn protease
MYFDKSKEEYTPYKPYSEKTAELIDERIKTYINSCYSKAKTIIMKNKKLIENICTILLDKEYLTKEEFNLLMNNKPLKTKKQIKKTTSKTTTKPKNKKTIIKKITKK